MEDVNQWVSDKTHHKIPTILADNFASLVLFNAIYLDFQWKEKFEKPARGWKLGEFTCFDGTKASVSMMIKKGDYRILSSINFEMIELPYLSPEDRHLTQLVFLPKDPEDLADLEKDLTFDNIKAIRKHAVLRHDVSLSIPKTKAESEFHLLDLLKNMGLPLDRLDKKVIGNAGYISDLIHKTYVATNEKGTEAAAATAVVFEKCVLNPESFNINRSYAYLIMDGDTILFQGRVCDKEPLVVDQ